MRLSIAPLVAALSMLAASGAAESDELAVSEPYDILVPLEAQRISIWNEI